MTEISVLDFRVKAIESTLSEIKDSQKSIARSLEKLVVLEERHEETARSVGRAFAEIAKMEDRLSELEDVPPIVKQLVESASEMKRVAIAVAGVVIFAAFTLVWNNAILSNKVGENAAAIQQDVAADAAHDNATAEGKK